MLFNGFMYMAAASIKSPSDPSVESLNRLSLVLSCQHAKLTIAVLVLNNVIGTPRLQRSICFDLLLHVQV